MYLALWCHKGLDKWDEVKSTNTVLIITKRKGQVGCGNNIYFEEEHRLSTLSKSLKLGFRNFTNRPRSNSSHCRLFWTFNLTIKSFFSFYFLGS